MTIRLRAAGPAAAPLMPLVADRTRDRRPGAPGRPLVPGPPRTAPRPAATGSCGWFRPPTGRSPPPCRPPRPAPGAASACACPRGRHGAGAVAAAQLRVLAGADLLAILPLPAPRWRAIALLPAGATEVRVELFGAQAAAGLRLRCTVLSRPAAALALAARAWPRLALTLIRGALRAPRALPGRLRAELGASALAVAGPDRASVYAAWARLFGGDPVGPIGAAGGSITVLVLHAGPKGAAFDASLEAAGVALAALGPSAGGAVSRAIAVGPGGMTLAQALAATPAAYLAVLQAGEILPPQALARLAAEISARDDLAILYADEDRLGPDGTGRDPLFKPAPSRTLMLSGTLATGVWLIRRDLLARPTGDAAAWAETLRLDAWLRLQEAGGAAVSRLVPLVLTHRRADTETAPAGALAAVARAHCARSGLPARIRAERPLGLSLLAPPSARPLVSLIVPSTCRAAHVQACLSAVLARTDYAALELVLVLTAAGPPDAAQRRMLAHLAADPRVRPVLVEAPRFNFAAACNRGAAAARGDLLCLLNDDVAPRDPAWLAAMVGHLADPAIGVVGARLLYPDGTVQHAGVVLRPDGTGAHWHRFLPARAGGYGGRARLAQEYSAVTGACLLTRRTLWERLGGLDEAFATAFNDVDFCLRARQAGAGVVLAAEAELTHGESQSFGRHYGPDEAPRNRADRARLLARFPEAFRADPFHSPNLSPWYGDGCALGFPPGWGLDPSEARPGGAAPWTPAKG